MSVDQSLLLVHVTATSALAGLIWTVQLVVYPAFAEVGPTRGWAAAHAAHARRISVLVAVPWAAQGASLAALLVRRPDGVGAGLLAAAAGLALAPVVVTVAVSLPMHTRLARGWDAAAWRRLLTTNWIRTAAWSAATLCAAVMVSRGS